MNRSSISLRQLEDHEWALLRELRLAAVADTPAAFLVHPERERPNVDDDWRVYLKAGAWLVAEDAGQAVGMLCVVVDPQTQGRYVESMWVAPRYRKFGIGARLLTYAASLVRAEHQASLFLWVLDGNDRARDFHHSQGFRPTGRRQPIGQGRIEEEFELDLLSDDVDLIDAAAGLTR